MGMANTLRCVPAGRADVSFGLLGPDRTLEPVDPVDELWVPVDEVGSASFGGFELLGLGAESGPLSGETVGVGFGDLAPGVVSSV